MLKPQNLKVNQNGIVRFCLFNLIVSLQLKETLLKLYMFNVVKLFYSHLFTFYMAASKLSSMSLTITFTFSTRADSFEW